MRYGHVTNNKNYVFYYDESNNIRVFTLKGNKYNVDNNLQNFYSPIFVLAGVVTDKLEYKVSTQEIRTLLNIQSNAKEIKMKHVGAGDFPELMDSEKVNIFLTWLFESDFYIHYFATNTVYWSFLDIIEDIAYYLFDDKRNLLFKKAFQNYFNIREKLDYYKNALYILIKKDKTGFLNLMNSFNYPEINNDNANKFYKCFRKFCRRHTNGYLSNNDKNPSHVEKPLLELTRLLSLCKDIDNAELTFDSKDILIDSFAPFYLNRVNGFRNSQHLLDEEDLIEPYLLLSTKNELINNEPNPYYGLDFKFVKSVDNIEIQISDVVAGIIRSLYTFIEQIEYTEIDTFIDNTTELQRKNIKMLGMIISKSVEECEGFIFRTQPQMDELKMHKLFS
ncbi:hypothetical protein CUU54_06815 [Pectobacterium polaris]|uniref:DUF3800 domain-containing protein n=1 Tax=Pectobacterium polaris TaxID=2042057 RepID=UPI000D611229|nr:DUF3800 domain-containing protein [Pectobacterium polaris]MCU1788570.1 hypothetical protein [Pectobacterium polaris]PWD61753.1 hypothetical protein DF209_07370 [Pectobacterium polaris]